MSSNKQRNTDRGTILIIEDEPDITRAYTRWLSVDYEVRVAHTGGEALDHLDDSISIILLDRRLPDISGEELLPEIRSTIDDCRVAIISTAEPDFEILDYGFDLYIEKPITEPETLCEAVRTLERRATFDSKMQEFLSLASKKAMLEASKHRDELEQHDEYALLLERIESLRADLDDVTVELDDEDLRVSFS